MDYDQWTANALSEIANITQSIDVLGDGLKRADPNGHWLEFGVASGVSLRRIVSFAEQTQSNVIGARVVGFDSFLGLPEAWHRWPKGHFRQEIIPVIDGARIVVGLFEDTLIGWISKQKITPKITFVHIDCDIYASAKYVLSTIAPFIAAGTIIVFDELINYKGFEDHELKALYETSIQEKLFSFEWIVRDSHEYQVSIRII